MSSEVQAAPRPDTPALSSVAVSAKSSPKAALNKAAGSFGKNQINHARSDRMNDIMVDSVAKVNQHTKNNTMNGGAIDGK